MEICVFPVFRAALRRALWSLVLPLGLGLAALPPVQAAAPLQAAEARAKDAKRAAPARRSEVKAKRKKPEAKAKRVTGGERKAEARRSPRKGQLRSAGKPRAKAASATARRAGPPAPADAKAAKSGQALTLTPRLAQPPAAPRAERPAAAGGAAAGLAAGASASGLAAALPAAPEPGLPQFDLHALKSSAALVIDPQTQEVLLAKNAEAVVPIASLTKLMTSLLVLEAGQPLDEVLSISTEDIDTEKGSSSRLQPGAQLSRGEMLHLALMSSENRAANALGRHYPGGLPSFVRAMNARALALGMLDTRFVEPTGLSSANQSSARDLALLVRAAADQPLMRVLSTSQEHRVAVGKRELQYRNTNGLVRNPAWEVVLQKTGYIAEAGRCLVMQTRMAGRDLIMVFLDSAGKYSRIGDAERVRRWVESQVPSRRSSLEPDAVDRLDPPPVALRLTS
ncbi:D-alanyl-D-alanine endopeptidase [Piscinibacter sp. Jin2]|uniref:D-alanyl-D-alanine endopeptidase n=1 Tax=Aquariibacter lacus TaxID=2801332 RepID=A0A9X1BNS4_9BURK|nr:D-alanyl-D-alanine endopeptidase [Piscinibacter lacus]